MASTHPFRAVPEETDSRVNERQLGVKVALGLVAALSVVVQAGVLARAGASVSEFMKWQVVPLMLLSLLVAAAFRNSKYRLEIVAIVITALSLRSALGMHMYTEVLSGKGFGSLFVKDDRYFFDLGRQLADGWRFGGYAPRLGDATQPGQVYLNAIVIYLAGADPRNVVVVSSMMGAATTALLIPVASSFVRGGWVLVPAALFAILPHQIYLSAANQRDVAITLFAVVLVATLLRAQRTAHQSRDVAMASLAVIALLGLLAAWRFASALAAALAVLAWALLASPPPRARWSAMVMLLMVALLSMAFLAPDSSVEQGPLADLAAIDSAYGNQFGSADTFGGFQEAGEVGRVLFLPLTIPLSVVFGFVPYADIINNDLNSLGFLYVWYPLVPPMVLGSVIIIRRWRWSAVALWGPALLLLLIGAVSYYGLVPRFRSSAEPFLLVAATVGLVRLRGLLPVYLPGILLACICVNVIVWAPSLLPVLGAGALAGVCAVGILWAQHLVRNRRALRKVSSHARDLVA
ncbi:MAG: hypothetical protein WD556_00680 [Actinomycetota bacterium]